MVGLIAGIAGVALGLAGAGKLDKTVVVGTDVAGYFLFHPDDLAHRKTSPMGWTSDDFACGAEFAAGTLVAIDTGGDGGAALRVTDGELTPREKARTAGPWPFRYRVRHGRVLLDGGNAVPSADTRGEAPPEDRWVDIADGNYLVAVYAIDRSTPGGDFDRSLPDYVFQFRPVKRLDTIKVLSPTAPLLEPGSRGRRRDLNPSWASLLDETSKPLNGSYPAFVKPETSATPGTSEYFVVTRALFDALQQAEEVVIVGADKAPGVGLLTRFSGGSRGEDDACRIGLHGTRLVKVTAFTKGDPLPRVSVAPLVRPSGRAIPADMKALKAEFAAYARANAAFRAAERNPDYQVERVASIESPTALTNLLLHLVPLPAEDRDALRPASDAARIRGLRAFLKTAR